MTKPIFLPLLDNGNGQVMAAFMMDYAAAFGDREVHMIRASDSHANRGMNKIANAFLDSDCDIWINIDADIRFSRADIDRLLSHDLPLVYGLYPKKQDDTPPCVCTFNEVPVPDSRGLAIVRRAGRGFMLVHRRVLEAMKEDNGGPALRYHNHGPMADGRDKIEWDFFPSGVVTGAFSALSSQPLNLSTPQLDADGYPLREWISEDWFFCERARALGFPTYVDTAIALGHVGQKEYRFGAAHLTRIDSNISSWREIPGWFDYEDVYRELAAEIPDDGTFVEVGSWLGRSLAAYVAFRHEANRPTGSVHAVDTFEGKPANATHEAILNVHGGNVEKTFRANMAACGLNGELTIHAMPSVDAASRFEPGSIDAVFIDADHNYEEVMKDIAAWRPNVKLGGILAGHDFDEEGVNRAVRESFAHDQIQQIGRCWLVQLWQRRPRPRMFYQESRNA